MRFAHSLVLVGCLVSAACTDRQEGTPTVEQPAQKDAMLVYTNHPCQPAGTPSPLYHDCQRVAIGADFSEAILVASPGRNLAALNFDSYENATLLVAFLDVKHPTETIDGFWSGRACLYLTGGNNPSSTADLKASIHRVSLTARCPAAPTQSTPARLRSSEVEQSRDVVPAVARIDTNYGGGTLTTFVGFRCSPTTWCEISLDGQTSPKNPAGGHHARRIKGWYDEQFLGVRQGGKLAPTPLYATIYPTADLASMTTLQQFDQPQQVGYVLFRSKGNSTAIRSALAKYRAKWGFPIDLTLSPDDSIAMYLQRVGTVGGRPIFRSHFQVRGRTGNPRDVNFHPDGHTATTADSAAVVSVVRGYPIPVDGVARWGYTEEGETAWVRCAVGCCEITGDNFTETTTTTTMLHPKKKP